MSDRVGAIALVVHETKKTAHAVAASCAEQARARGLEAVEWRPDTPLPARVDAIVGVGGDGTLLTAADLAIDRGLPVLGVNLGNVGYLADIEPHLVEPMLDGLVAGTLDEQRRMTVEVTSPDGRLFRGVNDIVFEKVMSQRLVSIAVEIAGEYFTNYRADGLIFATPLGSTAYSLSAGGPVLDPALEALILTPVAPHSLLSRSIVLSADARVRCTVALDRDVRINVDGREAMVIHHGDTVEVAQGAHSVRFLSLGTHPFPQAVRHQFGLDHA
jgi:NAD+ kinase